MKRMSAFPKLSIGAAIVSLFLLGVGCSGTMPDSGSPDDGSSTSKETVKQELHSSDTDLCEQYGYYSDGVCDDWCPKADPACDTYDPCGNKSCGERCTLCAPDDSDCVETAVVKYCQPDGTCASTSPQCPARGCQDDTDCASGEFCNKEGAEACTPSATGTCESKPSFCTTQYDPVCGCDGTTYSNSCKAASAGVNVASEGECATNTGCQDNSDCASGEYCNKTGANACSSSATGTCETKPSFCTTQYDPVCGCDGTTYSNSCEAASSGVNVNYQSWCF